MSPAARAVCAVATLLLADAVSAHPLKLSSSEVRVEGPRVAVVLKFAAAELASLEPLDFDGDGQLTRAELDRAGAPRARAIFREVRVFSEGPCELTEASPPALDREGDSDSGSDGVILAGSFACPTPLRRIEVRLPLLDLLPPGHTHLARISFAGDARTFDRVVQAPGARFTVERGESPVGVPAFALLGIEHIGLGFDHLAFLLALLLLGGTLRQLVLIVTSFTLAHSITLALAALEVVSIPSRIVEPLIALSICAVALENLQALRGDGGRRARVLRHRALVTFAFGLLHGFGFAGALRESLADESRLAGALLGFNLGVELGQLVIVGAMLPLLFLLRRLAWFATHGARALSVVVLALGLGWFVARLAG